MPTLAGSRHCCATGGQEGDTGAGWGLCGPVDPGSAAALAGLHPGDVIVQLAGQAIQTDQDVDRIMANVRFGQVVDLLAWRNGQTIRMTVRF